MVVTDDIEEYDEKEDSEDHFFNDQTVKECYKDFVSRVLEVDNSTNFIKVDCIPVTKDARTHLFF